MTQSNRALRARLRRAEGQLRGVIRMLDEDRDCADIITQMLAVRTAVERAAEEIVVAHLDECLTRLPPEQAREKAGQAIRLLGRLT